jgi:3-phenylpropionate/trans-cinnamate dioxygenase ferredoxin subunit
MDNEYTWHLACEKDAIEEEDVIDVTIEGKVYAVYWIDEGYFATDGLCTHEQSPLSDGFVSGDVIECAKHNARFHIPTGKALRKPALIDLKTYPVKVEGDSIFIGI